MRSASADQPLSDNCGFANYGPNEPAVRGNLGSAMFFVTMTELPTSSETVIELDLYADPGH
jgi:hypothetical protein